MIPEIVVFAVVTANGKETPRLFHGGDVPRGLFGKAAGGRLIYATRIDYLPVSNDLQRLFSEFKELRAANRLPAQNLKGVTRV